MWVPGRWGLGKWIGRENVSGRILEGNGGRWLWDSLENVSGAGGWVGLRGVSGSRGPNWGMLIWPP